MMSDEVVMRQDRVTYKGAMAAIDAGISRAEELGLRATISVVDVSGGIVAVARMDGPPASTVNAATGKATYSGTRGRSTEEFIESRLKHDDVLFRAVSQNPTTFLVPGGYPLMANDRCVGGVGVSGGKHQDDVKIAQAAIAGFEAAFAASGAVE
jgi:glc operon protein GlcG